MFLQMTWCAVCIGGCCKLCGSVEHLRSNCPEKLSIKSKSGSKLLHVLCPIIMIDLVM